MKKRLYYRILCPDFWFTRDKKVFELNDECNIKSFSTSINILSKKKLDKFLKNNTDKEFEIIKLMKLKRKWEHKRFLLKSFKIGIKA